jgi:hypothetical protein
MDDDEVELMDIDDMSEQLQSGSRTNKHSSMGQQVESYLQSYQQEPEFEKRATKKLSSRAMTFKAPESLMPLFMDEKGEKCYYPGMVKDTDSVMNLQCSRNKMKIGEIIESIETQLAIRQKLCKGGLSLFKPEIRVPGIGYFGTNYYKIKKQEEDDKAPIEEKDLPLSIRV